MLVGCTRFASAAWTVHLFGNTPPSVQPSIQAGIPPYTAISRQGSYVILPAYDSQAREHSMLVGPNLTSTMQDLNVAAGPTPSAYFNGSFITVNDEGETMARESNTVYFYQHWNHVLQGLPPVINARIGDMSFLDDSHHMYGQVYYDSGPTYGEQAIFIAKEPASIEACDSLMAYGNTGTPFLTDVSASGTDVGDYTDDSYNLHGFYGHDNSFTLIAPAPGFTAALPTSINDAGTIAGALTTSRFGQGQVFVLQGGVYTVIAPLGTGNFVDIIDFTTGICRVDTVDIDNGGNVFFPARSSSDYADVTYNYWNAATKSVSSLDSAIAPLLPANFGYTLDGMDVNGNLYGAFVYKTVPASSPYGEPTNYYHYFYVTP